MTSLKMVQGRATLEILRIFVKSCLWKSKEYMNKVDEMRT